VIAQIKSVRATGTIAAFTASFIAAERHLATTTGQHATFATDKTTIASVPATEFAAQYLGTVMARLPSRADDLFFIFTAGSQDYVVKTGIQTAHSNQEKAAVKQLVQTMKFRGSPTA
jgi:hypothetical protein